MSRPKIQKPKNTSAREYVSNKKLYQVMVEYIAAKKADPTTRVPEYVGECLFLIATRLAYKANFVNYSWRDEMISDGIENCILYIDNFNPEKTKNPFAYFTQIIYNAFIRRINKEKKQQYIKFKNTLDHQLQEQLINNTYIPENNEILNNFISNYEATSSVKKQKQKGLDILFVANTT